MSGLTCADRGQTNFAEAQCKSSADHPDPNQRGLVTYRDGRLVEGGEIGDCGLQGPVTAALSSFQTLYDGAPLSWGQSHLKALHRALGQSPGQSGNAFICSNPENAGKLVVNNDAFHRPALLSAIKMLSENKSQFPELDNAHYEAMLQSLRIAAGVPELPSLWDQFKGIAGYLLGGIFVFVLGGAGSHFLTEWLKGRFGGPKDPPSGGTGKTNGENFQKPESKAQAAAQAHAESKPNFGTVVGVTLFGGAAMLLKSLLSSGSAVPGMAPQGALGSGPVLLIMPRCEKGDELPLLCTKTYDY
jgi:hypothetical protein